MIDTLKYTLRNWYEKSELQGLYLVGSRSLNEENDFSDIDLFGITKKRLALEELSIHRHQLEEELKRVMPSQKIGFRVRSIEELPSFQSKLKSWGYDLLYSKRIFGTELNSILPQTDTIGFDKCLTFNNLIELLWYNQLCLNRAISTQRKNYFCIKSILNIISFILYHNEVFIPTTKERIFYVEKNQYLINHMSINIGDLHKTFLSISSSRTEKLQINVDQMRHNLIKDVYMNFLPTFEKIRGEFSIHDYWNYDLSFSNSLEFILSRINTGQKNVNIKYRHYSWRIIFMESLIELDSIRLNNPKLLLLSTKKFVNLFLKKDLLNSSDSIRESVENLLLKLEKERLNSSETRRDSRTIIT